eukprot:Pgem_evm1s13425
MIKDDLEHLSLAHHLRSSTEEELKTLEYVHICTHDDVHNLRVFFQEENYLDNLGLSHNAFIIRRNTPNVVLVGEIWTKTFLNFACKRDQATFEYSVWKSGVNYAMINPVGFDPR